MLWTIINIVAGSRLARIAGLVLAAGLILFTTIQYIQKAEREKVLQEIKTEEATRKETTRKRINEVKDNPISAVDDALKFLRDRRSD